MIKVFTSSFTRLMVFKIINTGQYFQNNWPDEGSLLSLEVSLFCYYYFFKIVTAQFIHVCNKDVVSWIAKMINNQAVLFLLPFILPSWLQFSIVSEPIHTKHTHLFLSQLYSYTGFSVVPQPTHTKCTYLLLFLLYSYTGFSIVPQPTHTNQIHLSFLVCYIIFIHRF